MYHLSSTSILGLGHTFGRSKSVGFSPLSVFACFLYLMSRHSTWHRARSDFYISNSLPFSINFVLLCLPPLPSSPCRTCQRHGFSLFYLELAAMKSHLLAATYATLITIVSGSTFNPARPPAIPLAGEFRMLCLMEVF